MTTKAGNEVFSEDQNQKACKVYNNMSTNIKSVTDLIEKLTKQVTDGEFDTKKGLSLLDLKNNTFLSYMTNLVYTTVLKLSGTSLDNHSVIDRLIEQRIVFERLGPYENKIKNQIMKYVEGDMSAQGAGDGKDTLELSEFASGETDKEDSDDDGGKDGGDSDDDDDQAVINKYIVPKITSNHLDDAESLKEKTEMARKRVLNSRMMQDALYEHNLEPDVIHNTSNLQRKAQKKRQEVEKYEEDNLTRLPISKKDKAMMKSMSTAGAMHGELLGFSDVSVLDGGSGLRPKKRKLSTGGSKKGKKKGSKKKKH